MAKHDRLKKPSDARLRAAIGSDAFDKSKAPRPAKVKRVGNFAAGANPDRGSLADSQIEDVGEQRSGGARVRPKYDAEE